MPLFHAIIQPAEGYGFSSRVKPDLTEFDLMRLVVSPFCSGKPIDIEGTMMGPDEIRQLRITQSDVPFAALEHDAARQASVDNAFLRFSNAMWRNSFAERASLGSDVTSQYLPRLSRTERAELGASVSSIARPGRVFVIHGRNEDARQFIFSFLIGAGLSPIDWEDAVRATRSASPFVWDVVRKGFKIAQATVVLMTPDEQVVLQEQLRNPDHKADHLPALQPRPNALLEAGLALGQAPKRTVILTFGDIRRISDLGGVHTLRFDGSPDNRDAILRRLETAGCKPRWDWPAWRHVGSFLEI